MKANSVEINVSMTVPFKELCVEDPDRVISEYMKIVVAKARAIIMQGLVKAALEPEASAVMDAMPMPEVSK